MSADPSISLGAALKPYPEYKDSGLARCYVPADEPEFAEIETIEELTEENA